jgi:hypothetical protein
MDPRFKQTEDQYFSLRGQLAAGRITRQQFEAELQRLVFQDASGRYWAIGADSGRWMTHDGRAWIAASPPTSSPVFSSGGPPPLPEAGPPGVQPLPVQPAYTAPAAVAPARSGGTGCGRGCLIGCIFLVLLCVVGAGGVWLGYQSGVLTPANLLNLAGLGPAYVEVDNFRDDRIEVKVVQLDVSKDSVPIQGGLSLGVFDVKTFRAGNAGKYRVDFTTRTGTAIGTCTIDLRGGDQYQFVTLPQRTIVSRANRTPVTGRDLLIETSALCRGGTP